MQFRSFTLACALASMAIAAAAPLAVDDHSFETNLNGPGGWSNYIGPSWQGTNGMNNGNAFKEHIPGFTADDLQHLGMVLNYDVWQDLGVTYQPNTRYTLTVAVGRRIDATSFGNQSQYRLADSTGAVYATGAFNAYTLPLQTFADAPPLVFDTPDHPAAVGKTIRILLRARGQGRSHFDHIRLDATPLPPPGSATIVNLPATNVTAGGATLNGEITNAGDGAPVVTLFWGMNDGGLEEADWENSLELAGTWNGPFSGAIGGLEPGTSYRYTTRATNSAGASWPVGSGGFETLPLPPSVVTLPASEIVAFSANIGAEVTDTGGEIPLVTLYYGTSPPSEVP